MDEPITLPHPVTKTPQSKPFKYCSIPRFKATTQPQAASPAAATSRDGLSPKANTHKLTARIQSPTAEQIRRKGPCMAQAHARDSTGSAHEGTS